ncbi:hypothetical protein VNI00_012376 [Paramarasmius palmivorus]|uniref:F-box domain-containing protein n=1 Tax=Paramarasmius palmivorus TaxID=297713 RepID=A0AAW0C8L7_9AGAR
MSFKKTTKADKLSQELIVRIIDILYGVEDYKTIRRACSLVNKRWRFEQYQKRVTKYKKFVELLANPHYTFQSQSRFLSIEGGLRDWGDVFTPTKANWMDPIFKHIDQWMSITSLTLRNIEKGSLRSEGWKYLTQDNEDAIKFRSRIERLTLEQFPAIRQEKDFMMLLAFIHGFSSLQYLSFDPFTKLVDDGASKSDQGQEEEPQLFRIPGLDEARAISLAQDAPSAPVTITEVKLDSIRGSNGIPYAVLFEWLRLGGASLRSLFIRLDVMHELDLPSFVRYLHHSSPNLEKLEFEAPYYGRDLAETMDFEMLMEARLELMAKFKTLFEQKPFEKCAAVQDITVRRMFLYELFNGVSVSLIPIDTFVSGICGQSLKHLRLEVWTDLADDEGFDREAEIDTWRKADVLLAGDAFPALESVVISISVILDTLFDQYFDIEEVAQKRSTVMVPYFRSILRKCHERGILKFKFEPIDLGW